jgi:Mn-dependent DtxR family transcriptional regulator
MSMTDGGRMALLLAELHEVKEKFLNGCNIQEYYENVYRLSSSISSIAEKRLKEKYNGPKSSSGQFMGQH